MMKYRNNEYNEKRNNVIRDAGLAVLAFGVAVIGHVLVETNSLAVAALSLLGVLGALGISALKTVKAEA